jgi:TfoX/Sxy family transcriptional regulator of competence genes
MAFSEQLANRIRESIAHLENIEEKPVMGGLTFMYNSKMCMGVIADERMCRINPTLQDIVLEKNGCRIMDFTKRPMKGFIMVNEYAMKTQTEFEYWIQLCLDFNSQAKSSKKSKTIK